MSDTYGGGGGGGGPDCVYRLCEREHVRNCHPHLEV